MWSFEMVAAMLAVGAVAGVIAGMFGVGGGTILVPLVLWILQMQGAENFQYAQHIAIGTSFAVMVFTSFASASAQYKRQAVDMDVLRAMVPGVLCGVAAGALVARYCRTRACRFFSRCLSPFSPCVRCWASSLRLSGSCPAGAGCSVWAGCSACCRVGSVSAAVR